MVTVGLIGEGPSDLIILEHLITKAADDATIDFTNLQPKFDPDQPELLVNGSWGLVLAYCESEELRDALETSPSLRLVIQVDSDVFDRQLVQQEHRFPFNKEDGTRLTVAEIVTAIANVLIGLMGADLYKQYQDRIIFAVAVDETECWLLPFYYDNKQAGKTTGCLAALNKELVRKYKLYIDSKNPEYYRTACKPILKEKRFEQKYKKNESLAIFIDQIKELPFEEE
jgi:hypothetical protein